MATISIVNYIHDLKEAGFTDRQAEAQARKIEPVTQDVRDAIKQEIQDQELVSRSNLHVALHALELHLVKWMLGTGITAILVIAGLFKYMH
jgi:hypothetical protein